jgi:hypothetical protein
MKAILPVIAIAFACFGISAAHAGANQDKYGTRDPATCATRTAPPNAQTAARYFICDAEHESGDAMYLVNNVKVQVAPKGRPFNMRTDSWPGVDPSQPIYDIRGSFRNYQCSAKNSLSWENHPGQACAYGDQPNATGECYRDTFADWHCKMLDVDHAGLTVMVSPPPK